MTICSPEAGNIARGRSPRAIFPVEAVNKSSCHPHSRATIVLLYRTTFETTHCVKNNIILHTSDNIVKSVRFVFDFLSLSLKISRAFNVCLHDVSIPVNSTTRLHVHLHFMRELFERQRVILPARVTLPWYLTICRPPRDLLWANQIS